MNTVIFVCTANYFRSRFAEGLFNHLAAEVDLPWRAISRGIIADEVKNRGISPYTVNALKALGAEIEPSKEQDQLTEKDLRQSERVIVLDRGEHLPMMYERFPRWYDMVDYWHIPDVDRSPPAKSIQQMEHRVRRLIEALGVTENSTP